MLPFQACFSVTAGFTDPSFTKKLLVMHRKQHLSAHSYVSQVPNCITKQPDSYFLRLLFSLNDYGSCGIV